jgi:NADPH-dependent curcumin reductase CurA
MQVACGSISGYNTANPYGVTNLFNIVTKRILMQASDHRSSMLGEFRQVLV